MSNLNLNKVIIAGRITGEPKLSTTANGNQTVSFSLAINRKVGDKDYPAYPNCKAWGKTADIISRYFHKGSSLCAVGHIDTHSYEKNGEKRYVTEVVVDEVYFVDSLTSREKEIIAEEKAADEYGPLYDDPDSSDDDLPF